MVGGLADFDIPSFHCLHHHGYNTNKMRLLGFSSNTKEV